jgi:inorganic pyrophosphatase
MTRRRFRVACSKYENDRLVACPKRHPGVTLRTDSYDSLHDLPKDLMAQIERFLVDYSEEEGNKITFEGTASRKDAFALIRKGEKRFRKRGK